MAASTSKESADFEEQEKTSDTLLSSTVDLTHPEILPCSTLRSLFKEKGLGDDKLDGMDKAALVQFFYATILPLPQRKYRANRSGTELTEKQEARKRASSVDDETSDRPSKRVSNVNSLVNGSGAISLKKGASESPRKLVSLSKDTSDTPKQRISFEGDSGNSSKQVISLKRSTGDVSQHKSSENSAEKSDCVAKGSRVIKLINRTLQGEVEKNNHVKSTSDANNHATAKENKDEANKEDTPTSAKRHARITWP